MNFILRKWEVGDINNLVKHANNYNVSRYLTDAFPYPYTFEDGQQYLEFISKDNPTKAFAIDVDGETIGAIGLFPQTDIHRKNAELGYWLSEQYWGQGIMVRAIKEITEYGFNTFDIIRIFARPFSINIQSQKVLQKAGFVKEGTFQKTIYKNGEYMDEIYFSLYKSDIK